MSAAYNNLAHLTVRVAAKRAAKKDKILFDDDARREFLTGFHKRKVAKAEAARAKAKDREKQERLESRREKRRHLREQAVQNAAQVEQAYGAVIDHFSDHDEWNGIDNDGASIQQPSQRDDLYEDEETLATVTVVEDFDPDSIIYGPPKSDVPTQSYAAPKPVTASQPPSKLPKKQKSKSKKVRYETKDARRREQSKQRARKHQKAELAGGKTARKNSGGRNTNFSKR